MFYDMFHILLSCDSLRNPWNVYCIVLYSVFGPKMDEVTGEWRKLHNEELNDLYSLPNIVRVVKSR